MLNRNLGGLTLTLWIAAACIWLGTASTAHAVGPLFRKPDPLGAKTDAKTKADAMRAIPRDRLTPDALAKVDAVLGDVAIFRRMPIRVVPCDPGMYLFLVRHPDVVVNVWDVLQLSELAMSQTAPGQFAVTDNQGTDGHVEFLYQGSDMHIIYSEGKYDGPLTKKPLTGRSLVVLKTGYVREPDGRYYITSRLDAFVQVDHRGIELLTKTLHPLVGKVADVNFTQTVAFVGSLSKTAEVDPDGMQRLAGRLDKIDPQVAQQFATLSAEVASKAAQLSEKSSVGAPSMVNRTSLEAIR